MVERHAGRQPLPHLDTATFFLSSHWTTPPYTRRAFRCWNRFSDRGATLD